MHINKFVCHSFKDMARRPGLLGSETKVFITHGTANIMSINMSTSVPFASKSHRGDMGGHTEFPIYRVGYITREEP